jgi:hypothetical protein
MDIFNLLKSILNFYHRQWKFILIILLSGAILGFVYDTVKTPYYETSATVTSGLSYFEGIIDPNKLDYPIIDQKIAINMVNALAEIVDKNEYEVLAKKLNIDLDVAKSIKFIEAKQLYELDLENRRQKLSQFLITARITDNNSIRIFSDALLDFFNRNGYSNKNYQLFQEQSPKFLNYIDYEIVDLKAYRNSMLGKSEVELSSISIANDKSEVLQNQIIQLYEKRQAIERNIALLKPLSYVSNFPVYKNPKDRTWFRIGTLSGAFFLLGIVVALFKDVSAIMNR